MTVSIIFHSVPDGQIGLRESLTAGVGPQDLGALHGGHVGTLTFQSVFCPDRATKAVVRADQTNAPHHPGFLGDAACPGRCWRRS